MMGVASGETITSHNNSSISFTPIINDFFLKKQNAKSHHSLANLGAHMSTTTCINSTYSTSSHISRFPFSFSTSSRIKGASYPLRCSLSLSSE